MMRFLKNLKENRYHQDNSKKERIRTQVEKEDFLLSQIDEFREKAKQLQALVTARESKVRELQNLVDEREGKAERLQNILDEKQQEADKLQQTVEGQIHDMVLQVEDKMDKLGDTLKETMDTSVSLNDQKVSEMKTIVTNMQEEFSGTKTEIAEKVHEENVTCYRNIQTLFDEMKEQLDKTEETIQSMGNIKSYVKCLAWLSMMNFIVLIGFILYQLGVFF